MINIYCDESCHLENDKIDTMVLGGVSCPHNERKFITREINKLKIKYNISKSTEVKWTKVSPNKLEFYKEMIELFNEHDFLKFRAVIIPNKKELRHSEFNQDHNGFYYKIYYTTLVRMIKSNIPHNIYIDIRDTHTYEKSRSLLMYLRYKYFDDGTVISKIQPIDSYEVSIMQLTDLFVGMVAYKNRRLNTSKAKVDLIYFTENLLDIKLDQTYYGQSDKFDILKWKSNYKVRV